MGFYFPGKELPWDVACGGAFLSNFYPTDDGITFAPPGHSSERHTFRCTESAYQACKFWSKAAEFAPLSGEEAYQLKKKLRGQEDRTMGGAGSNWMAMFLVLHEKFRPGSVFANGLVQTEDAFLLEHNPVEGRDLVWSDNKVGDGTNWLGLQLMLVRGELLKEANPQGWPAYIRSLFNLETGSFLDEAAAQEWQRTVKAAGNGLREHLSRI